MHTETASLSKLCSSGINIEVLLTIAVPPPSQSLAGFISFLHAVSPHTLPYLSIHSGKSTPTHSQPHTHTHICMYKDTLFC